MTRRRAGVVLVVVLVVVAMLALGSYSFVQLMNTEARAAQAHGRMVQARAAADSGVHFVAAILLDQKFSSALGTDAYNAASMFHGQVVTDESAAMPSQRCRFSIISPVEGAATAGDMRFGLMDEAGKINLVTIVQRGESQGNQAGGGTGGGGGSGSGGGSGETNPLLYLPNMTQEIADAILDWIDEDDNPRQYGAERDYYQSLSPPYSPRNAPIHSLDELLLVAGVTPRLLYGEDANQNGILDPNEDDGELSNPYDDANGTLDRGWLAHLTLFSRESNTDLLGVPRIFLNNDDLQALYDELANDSDFGEERARFVIAYRLFGPASSQNQPSPSNTPPPSDPNSNPQGQPNQNQTTPQTSASSSSSQQTIAGLDASGGAQHEIQSVIDLIGSTVNAKIPGQQNTSALRSPFQESDIDSFLDMLLDRTTTTESTELWGRVNVNTAPWPVLMSLPQMTEELADAIVAARGTTDTSIEALSNLGVSWLVTSGAMTKEEFKAVEQYVTGQTQVFRIHAAGYFEERGPVSRIEAVIDLAGSSPRIRYWRDLTSLGRGFDPQMLLQSLSH